MQRAVHLLQRLFTSPKSNRILQECMLSAQPPSPSGSPHPSPRAQPPANNPGLSTLQYTPSTTDRLGHFCTHSTCYAPIHSFCLLNKRGCLRIIGASAAFVSGINREGRLVSCLYLVRRWRWRWMAWFKVSSCACGEGYIGGL